jgi:hypothetical protein
MDAAELLEIVRRDLDPVTLAIVEGKLADANRLSIIRDAFMEGRDALAVKMIRDLDEYRVMRLLPISAELRHQTNGYTTGALGVEPGGSFQITSRPQMPFRPSHLLLSRQSAKQCTIHDIRVGTHSMFVQAGNVPGDIFAADIPAVREEVDEKGRTRVLDISARGGDLAIRIDIPLMQPGTDIAMVLTNTSDEHLPRFEGAWLGALHASYG